MRWVWGDRVPYSKLETTLTLISPAHVAGRSDSSETHRSNPSGSSLPSTTRPTASPIAPSTSSHNQVPFTHSVLGLANLGNTCYMNAVNQVLLYVPSVLGAFRVGL